MYTGKTILSNPSLFKAHIQEIDKELNDGPPTHEINEGRTVRVEPEHR